MVGKKGKDGQKGGGKGKRKGTLRRRLEMATINNTVWGNLHSFFKTLPRADVGEERESLADRKRERKGVKGGGRASPFVWAMY